MVYGEVLAWNVSTHCKRTNRSLSFMKLLHEKKGRLFLKNAIHPQMSQMLRRELVELHGENCVWTQSDPEDHRQICCCTIPVLQNKVCNLGAHILEHKVLTNQAEKISPPLPSLLSLKQFAQRAFPEHIYVEISLFKCNTNKRKFTTTTHHVDGKFLPFGKEQQQASSEKPVVIWLNFDGALPLELWSMRHKSGQPGPTVYVPCSNTDAMFLSHNTCHRTICPNIIEDNKNSPRGKDILVCEAHEHCHVKTEKLKFPLEPTCRMKFMLSTEMDHLAGYYNSKHAKRLEKEEIRIREENKTVQNWIARDSKKP